MQCHRPIYDHNLGARVKHEPITGVYGQSTRPEPLVTGPGLGVAGGKLPEAERLFALSQHEESDNLS